MKNAQCLDICRYAFFMLSELIYLNLEDTLNIQTMAIIAYFDYLGFRKFIERNEPDYQKKIIEDNFLIIENSLGKGKLTEMPEGYVTDLSNMRINCVNFSDTVIFWSKEETIEVLKEILEVSVVFNWSCILFTFPIRGAIIQGDILDYGITYKNEIGGIYSVNSLFGRGIIQAYDKVEQQNWAGTVIDQSIENFICINKLDADTFLGQYAKKYQVPYEVGKEKGEPEWVLNIGEIKGKLNEEEFNNWQEKIIDNFSKHNKSVDSAEVQLKINNTIKFLESYI